MVNDSMSPGRRKRILFVHSSNELYGSDKVLLQLVSGLDRNRFHPIVVLPSDLPYEGKLGAALDRAGVQHHSIRMGVLRRRYFNLIGGVQFLLLFFIGLWQLRRLVKQYHVDLIHSNTSAVLGGAIVAGLYHIPHVWHIHEILEEPLWFCRLLYRFIGITSTRVVAVSKAVAEQIRKYSGSTTPHVIWNGVDCSIFSPDVDGTRVRSQWQIAEDVTAVGVVGRVSYWKGQDVFLKAASKAISSHPDLHFVIVGDPVPGEEEPLSRAKAQVRELNLEGNVTFMSFTPDVPEVMRALDIVVLPSKLPEPLGLVVLEAMASERPVVATAHGGPLETVKPNETGLLVSPNDSDTLSRAITVLAQSENRRSEMGRKGRRRVLRHFSLQRFRKEFTELYSTVIVDHTCNEELSNTVSDSQSTRFSDN